MVLDPPPSRATEAQAVHARVAWIPSQLREHLSLARKDRRPSLPTTTTETTATTARHDGLERTHHELRRALGCQLTDSSTQVFRILGDCSHLLSKCILIFAIHRNRSSEGTQYALFLLPLPPGADDDDAG